jgi:hypothetical protein
LRGVELLVNPALSSGGLFMGGGGMEREVKHRSDSSNAIIRELREAQDSTALYCIISIKCSGDR